MTHLSSPDKSLSVTSPPNGVPPAPPVTTRMPRLPFGELTWENFERLCHRLIALEGDVEHCTRYGRQGDAQAGIDVYARQANGRYHCLQAKRHQNFGAAQIRQAVAFFLAGSWASKTERFTIAIQSSLHSAGVQNEIEQQAAELRAQGIVFVALDGEDLTNQLRRHPELVDDFFGRPWVQALLGDEAAAGLNARLDGAAFAKARTQLTRVYDTHFHFVDPGSFGSIGDDEGRLELTLLERFLKPDILVRETPSPLERPHGRVSDAINDELGSLPSHAASEWVTASAPLTTSRMRRLPLHEWIGEAQRLVLLGDAGSGKSTLLRVIALDLLRDQSHFPELAARWGRHLPVYIPFARWSAQAARVGGMVGIKHIVRRSLEQLLTGSLANLIDQAIEDNRVLLLIDGLDEWSNEQAARTTLGALVTSVEAHGIPVVVSGRPRGLEKIGSLPTAWRRGMVAPLSVTQQGSIASRWFSRFSSQQGGVGTSDTNLRTNRFMAELARDPNLTVLATTPLLLVGLVTLALRGQILPRTRGDVYDQLVRVLLEVHPSNRATAAGDTELRFRYAIDPDQRRAAIAHLAYAVRKEAGGAGMALASARRTLQTFLASPSGFALDNTGAARAAAEILSVNSEMQGLLVEKGPGEVGFVHASFEEYLGAEYIGGWPFDELTTFVRSRAGEARWRNVITNLLGYLQRRDEIDRLVAVIEEPCSDELSHLNRQALLGDIAFGVSARAPATAKRLAFATMQRVESEDWLPARREALGSVLKGLSDPALKAELEKRLVRWLPARNLWQASLIEALGSWQPTPELQDMLFRAMHDGDSYAQRAAANSYAKVFSSSESACQRLINGLARSRDLQASAAMLESLAHGWPTAPSAIDLFQQAWDFHRGGLRLVGALGLCAGGSTHPEAMRDLVLGAQSFWSGLSQTHQALAAKMLAGYWPDDPELIQSAIARMSGYGDSLWEYGPAGQYLLACDVTNLKLRQWVLRELRRDHPFNFDLGGRWVWLQVAKFAAVDPEIRVAATKYWQDSDNRLIRMHNLVDYVTQVADPELNAILHGVFANDKHSLDRMWALKALLTGWGRDHPNVQSVVDSVIESPDEKLEELVSLLPFVYADKELARERLLHMGRRPSVRRDLLSLGLAQCGCDGSDDEAVQTILSQMDQRGSVYDLSHVLFQSFGSHPAVRAMAAQSLRTEHTALTAIAIGYADDAEFTQPILSAALPLPVDLRTQIVEVAAEGATGTALETILGKAMLESDSELRVRMMIAHYARLPVDAHERAKRDLLEYAVAIGPDFDSVRAAALAGLTAIGALEELAELKDQGKPLSLHTGRASSPMQSLARQICERFADFESAFGAALPNRFDTWGMSLGEILTAAPRASPAARAAFLSLAERGGLPRTVQATHALAVERPHSTLLLQHCWDVLEEAERNNTRAAVNGEIGAVLRTHFPSDTEVQKRLVIMYKQRPSAEMAVTLAVYSPHAAELPMMKVQDLGQNFGDWAAAVHVAACRADSCEFTVLLEAMVTREFRSEFDAQKITNLAVQERLQRDSELQRMLGANLQSNIDRSISGSFARYLAAVGKLHAIERANVVELLRAVTADQSLPLAGYDAIADEWRCTRATLLDALSAGLELT